MTRVFDVERVEVIGLSRSRWSLPEWVEFAQASDQSSGLRSPWLIALREQPALNGHSEVGGLGEVNIRVGSPTFPATSWAPAGWSIR
jgi:hypothetical protein